MRIISLIPGATEIVSALGLINSLVGVSHECDYPNEVIKLPKLTKSNVKDTNVSFKIHQDIKKILSLGLSVYEVDTKLLKELRPDIIITQSQCSVCAVGLDDVKKSLNLWLSKETILIDLKSLSFSGIMDEILEIGKKLNKINKANTIVKNIYNELEQIKQQLTSTKKKNVLCVEWLDPLMTSGNWMPDLLEYSNAFDSHGLLNNKSHSIELDQIEINKVDLIIFMPCGFDIERTKNELINSSFSFMSILKNKSKFIVDGNKYFNRPGPNLLESIKILCEIIHPDIYKPNPSKKRWIKFEV